MAQHALRPLLMPNSLAIWVGDHTNAPIVQALLPILLTQLPRGKMHFVGRCDIGKTPVHQVESIEDLPFTPELLVVAGPLSSSFSDFVAQCAAKGIQHLVTLIWIGEETETMQAALKEHNVRMIGPNSFGICRPKLGVNPWLGATAPLAGRLALMSQSGTVASAVVDWATWQGIGFSQIVAMGSPVDIMPSQVLDFLSNDFESQAILMYLQSIGQPTRFLSSLRAAGRSKPVAVVTEHGTGADERVLDAALTRTGAVRGHRLNDLVSAAAVMTNARRVKDGSLIIIGNGAGPGELAAQRAREVNVSLLSPNDELRTKLENVMALRGSVGPVTTVWASCPTDLFINLADVALQSRDCGAVLLMLSPTALLDTASLYDQVLALHKKQRKLVMVCMLGGGTSVKLRTKLAEAGIPTFRTPEAAIEGFQFLEQFQRNQHLAKQAPDSHAFRFKIDLAEPKAILNELLKQKNKHPTTDDLKSIFEMFQIRLTGRRQSSYLLQAPIHLRAFQDPVFGPAIGLSIEGANQWNKSNEAVALPPLNTVLAKDLIHRAFPGVESFELEELLRNFSTMICELPEFAEITMADVRIHDSGSIFADISTTLRRCRGWRRYSHLAFHPYPRQWVEDLELRNGQAIVVRPVLPRDAEMMADFVRNLSHQSRYFRFISNLEELTPRMLASMSHIDYDREMALMAVGEDSRNTNPT